MSDLRKVLAALEELLKSADDVQSYVPHPQGMFTRLILARKTAREALSEAESALQEPVSGEEPYKITKDEEIPHGIKLIGPGVDERFFDFPSADNEGTGPGSAKEFCEKLNYAFQEGRREGQHAHMTNEEAPIEAIRRWGAESGCHFQSGCLQGKQKPYGVWNGVDWFYGDSWGACFKAADEAAQAEKEGEK